MKEKKNEEKLVRRIEMLFAYAYTHGTKFSHAKCIHYYEPFHDFYWNGRTSNKLFEEKIGGRNETKNAN